MFLDAREIKRESHGWDGDHQHGFVEAAKRKGPEQKVSGDADDCHRNTVLAALWEHSIRAVVDDAAIPAVVNVAGRFAVGAILFAQRECGCGDADESEDDEEVFHRAIRVLPYLRTKPP